MAPKMNLLSLNAYMLRFCNNVMIFFVNLSVSLCVFSNSYACMVSKKMDYGVIGSAEVVLRANIINYRLSEEGYAVFDLETVDRLDLKTVDVPHWKAVWRNSTFSMPAVWDGPIKVIVGLNAVIRPDGKPEIEIVQQSCGPRTILEDNDSNLRYVIEAISHAN